jgi:pyruvate formate-lyase/glycerol dehydratase family glycyl radical enzyme
MHTNQTSSELFHYQLHTKPKRTNRIEELLEYVHSIEPEVCIERAKCVTEAYREYWAYPNLIRRARSLERTLKKMTLFILPGSYLVGNQASKPRSAPLFPEYTVDFLEAEIFESNPVHPAKRPTDRYNVDETLLPELRAIIDWWKGKTFKEMVYAVWPEEVVQAQDWVGVLNDVNFMHGGDGHYTPDSEWLLRVGLRGAINEANGRLAGLRLSDTDYQSKKEFYEAMIISYEAVMAWAYRYSELAREMSLKETNPQRREELTTIADMCTRVPENPPRTYAEALQFLAFVQISIQIETNGQGISPGRLDQILYPYYKQDVELGRIDYAKALELMENFFILLYILDRFRSWPDTNFFRGKPMFQTITVGGVDPVTLRDATNEISYVILDAIANTRLTQPSHYVRWHRNAPLKFKMKVAEVIRLGTGYPAIANDDLFVQTMTLTGYDPADAYNYAVVSCAETGVPGMRGGRTGAAWFCLAKIFEMTLHGGKDLNTGLTLYGNVDGKDLGSFSSWNELYEAFLRQVDHYVDMAVYMDNCIDALWEEHLEDTLQSAFGCPQTALERGKSVKQGGAKYDFTGNETIGLANVANSLYAIKRLVFDDGVLTGEQLKHALETNFEDMTTAPTGPVIQQMCLSQPKYGNDIDEVDFIAASVLEYVCKAFWSHKNTRYGRGPMGGTFQASTTTVSSNTPFGMITGALPDGRKKGDPLADGNSPMRGTDTLGPTANVKSSSKLRFMYLSEGSLYNLKLRPTDLKD